MNETFSRRQACRTLLHAGALILIPATRAAAYARPFCRFSLADGWTDRGSAAYVTATARDRDRSGVPHVVDEIERHFDFRAEIDVYVAENQNNAFATIAGGRKILVVDVRFLENVNRLTGTQWSAIQVIAHEIGHHIAGFADDAHRNELNADYWSGQALQRLGSAKDAATTTILTLGTEADTPSHPNKYARAQAVAQGWVDSTDGRVDYSHCLECR